MTGAVEIYNDQGLLIVSTNDPVLVVVAKGNQSTFGQPIAWRGWPEPPTFFIQPVAESWIGGHSMLRYRDTAITPYSAGSFNWVACCSPGNWGIGSESNFGLETYSDIPDRKLLFSTNLRFARIKQILAVPGPYTSGGGSIISSSVGFSGFSTMPWIGIRDACISVPIPAGDMAYSQQFLIKINAALNTLTATIDDSFDNAYNQFYGKYMYFPIAEINGNL